VRIRVRVCFDDREEAEAGVVLSEEGRRGRVEERSLDRGLGILGSGVREAGGEKFEIRR
jgi:hypothetical protein